ncbi:MAG: hypothetical protein LBU11_01935 [Zoogloeaceae bacterium]|jgi:hypothetical protein|nr:hypothetical protein [Zoogloeaceae bacterium]
MNADILLNIDGNWMLVEEGCIRAVPEYPRLAAPTLVLTDFGGAVSGVSTIHEKKHYAEALIGRRLRDDGVIENEETKVLIHCGAPVSDGWQALYTAMPMTAWRRMQSWIASQDEHCLVIAQAALMRRLIRRDGEGVVFHGGKRISVLAQERRKLCYFSARVRGDEKDDSRACAMTLAGRIRQEQTLEVPGQRLAFRWYAFGEAGLAEIFAAHSESRVEEVKREGYLQDDGTYRYFPLEVLAPCLSERIAVNTLLAKASYFAERNIGVFSLSAGILALACLVAGLAFFFQAVSIRREVAALGEDTRKIVESTGEAGGMAGMLPPDFFATRDFIDLLSAARTETNPGDLLQNLRLAAGDDIKLLRVYMQADDRRIVIEGWGDATAGGDQQLANFLARLRQLGFEPEAIDVTLAPRAAPPGSAFAYRLNPDSRSAGDIS